MEYYSLNKYDEMVAEEDRRASNERKWEEEDYQQQEMLNAHAREEAEVLLRHYEVSNTGTEERLTELRALVKGNGE